MAYELWNQQTANIIGEFETEDAALAYVRRALQTNAYDFPETWALAYEDEHEETHSVAFGKDLRMRAARIPA